MRLGIMQPYFLPYLGYFSLINATDSWVVFDTVQYINKGWVNRNRVLSQSKDGVSYITVPVVKKSRDMLINETLIDNKQNWREKIFGQVNYYKKRAPYFFEVKKILEQILEFNTNYLAEINIYSLELICRYLNIPFNYRVFSKDTMDIGNVDEPDEWALEISIKMGANTYINPPGGKSFFNKSKYDNAGIQLLFLNFQFTSYKTNGLGFIPGLSVIDAMMFNSPEEINRMLDSYELE